MKKISLLLLAFALVAGMVTLQSCQSTKTSTASKMLKFNFEKGKSYDYEMVMNMDQFVMDQTMKMDMTMYYSMDVKETEGDAKVITVTYDRFKLAMNMGAIMNIDVDTDKPMPETEGTDAKKDPMKMMNRVFGAIKGKQFVLKVSPEGKVIDVTGMKELANSIMDSFEGIADDAEAKAQMRAMFEKQFNDADVKSQFERILYIFPNKEVKVGDTWEKTTSTSGQMPAKYVSTYKVTEIEGDMVTLEEDSKISTSGGTMEMEGKVKGEIVVDSRSGLIVTADQKMDITAKAEGMKIDMKAVTKVKGKAN